METDSTETAGVEGTERSNDAGLRSRAKRVASSVTERGGNGRAALAAGGLLLARAARAARGSRRRAAAMGLAGATLVGIGLRQRRSGGASDAETTGTEGSAEATAHLEQSDVMHQSERNPRGTSGEPDVETETDPDRGAIQFTDEGDGPRSEPHLDADDAHDPRLEDDEAATEVDLSEASMADEASEATGPSPEQGQPASTEETEPEATPEEDESHVAADAPDGSGSADEESDAERDAEAAVDPADDGRADEGSTDDG